MNGPQLATSNLDSARSYLELKTIRPHCFSCMYGTHFCASYIVIAELANHYNRRGFTPQCRTAEMWYVQRIPYPH